MTEKKLNEKEVKRHISERLHKPSGELMRDTIFGMSDGIVTTLALVAGVTGVTTAKTVIIVAGLAAAFSSSISMGLGNYISLKSEIELYKREIEREKKEIEKNPEFEKEEIREIYARKGFTRAEQKIAVKRISENNKRWLEFMVKEELGLGKERFNSPIKAGLTIGIADILTALIPVVPFFFLSRFTALYLAIVLSMVTLFGAGAFKTKFTGKNWVTSGLETMLIGAIAAGVAYLLGTWASSF